MSVSDYLRANTNTEQCGNFKVNNSNYSKCPTTNYIVSSVPTSGHLWTISPRASTMDNVLFVDHIGYVSRIDVFYSDISVLPALYLKSDITLSGSGTETEPYTIIAG